MFGLPAARLKGLYLAIATLAAQFILLDFFARARLVHGRDVAGAGRAVPSCSAMRSGPTRSYFYVVARLLVVCFLAATNLMRTRDGRALVAVRDHYLSAEIMGINLTNYRTLSFGIAAFYRGHRRRALCPLPGVRLVEGFNILFSIQFLAMVIIGGLGSIMGTPDGHRLHGAAAGGRGGRLADLAGGSADRSRARFGNNIAFLREMAIGAGIILFLIFEPDGLAHRWRQIKAYWKLYPFRTD